MDGGWSPDGKQTIFGSFSEPDQSISIVDVATRRISTVPASKGLFSPRWSPDGKYIAATEAETFKLMLFDVTAKTWTDLRQIL